MCYEIGGSRSSLETSNFWYYVRGMSLLFIAGLRIHNYYICLHQINFHRVMLICLSKKNFNFGSFMLYLFSFFLNSSP